MTEIESKAQQSLDNYHAVEKLLQKHPEMSKVEACKKLGVHVKAYWNTRYRVERKGQPLVRKYVKKQKLPDAPFTVQAASPTDKKLIMIVGSAEDIKGLLRDNL